MHKTSIIVRKCTKFARNSRGVGKGGLIGRDIFRMRMVQYSEMYPEKRDEYLELAKMDVPEILNYGNKWSSI